MLKLGCVYLGGSPPDRQRAAAAPRPLRAAKTLKKEEPTQPGKKLKMFARTALSARNVCRAKRKYARCCISSEEVSLRSYRSLQSFFLLLRLISSLLAPI